MFKQFFYILNIKIILKKWPLVHSFRWLIGGKRKRSGIDRTVLRFDLCICNIQTDLAYFQACKWRNRPSQSFCIHNNILCNTAGLAILYKLCKPIRPMEESWIHNSLHKHDGSHIHGEYYKRGLGYNGIAIQYLHAHNASDCSASLPCPCKKREINEGSCRQFDFNSLYCLFHLYYSSPGNHIRMLRLCNLAGCDCSADRRIPALLPERRFQQKLSAFHILRNALSFSQSSPLEKRL